LFVLNYEKEIKPATAADFRLQKNSGHL